MTSRKLLPAAVLVALSACLLTACGGGGGNGMVRPETVSVQPVPPPLPPPPPPPPESCPAPITGDCVVNVPDSDYFMKGGRQSNYKLLKDGEGSLYLYGSDSGSSAFEFRFGGGTTINGGDLGVGIDASLNSNVTVQNSGSLLFYRSITGNLDNHGYTYTQAGTKVFGDLINDGTLVLEAGADTTVPGWDAEGPLRIEGNFSQTPNGILEIVLFTPTTGPTASGSMTVTGRAVIDGTLQLNRYIDTWGPYPLPGAPLSLQVLHADGGVFGQFAQWTSPGLLITGALRYLTNDVYFDATSIAAAPAMSAVGADPLTVQSAAHFDAALNNVAKAVTVSGAALSTTQHQFLSSVGTIQRLQDYAQAAKTFDSLSGHGYADAADSLLQQAATPSAELMNRVGNLRAGLAAGAWSTQSAMLASGGSTFSGQRGGFDQWFGERLLLGSSFGWSDGSLRFDRSGGSARDESPQWDVYLRRNGSGNTYVFGDVGYSRHQLDFNRQIDLGLRRQTAGTRQSFDVMRAWVETGRDYRLGSTRLTPFGAMSYAVLHGAGFAEQGSTGFELIAQPSTYQRLNAVAGLRLGTDWRSSSRWTSLNLTAGLRQSLLARNDARAAFAGTPEVSFALDGMPSQRNTGWLQMSLATGGAKWNWLLNYDRQASDQAVSLGANFRF